MAGKKPAKKNSVRRARRKESRVTERRAGKASEPDRFKGFDHFGKEVSSLGERISRKADVRKKRWDSWFHCTLGICGPLVSAIFGLLMIGALIWGIAIVYSATGTGFLALMQGFLTENLAAFFVIFLFFSYSSYFSRADPESYEPLSPFFSAIGVTIGFWLIGEVLALANQYLGIGVLDVVVSAINDNLFWVFLAFIVIGYAYFAIRKAAGCPQCDWEEEEMPKNTKKTERPAPAMDGGVKRLYRSGKDKILGGVCGGIAEYLGVDPVLIRLLWVIGTLAWGFGLLAYIIAWIIIPRNPRHRWE